MDKGIELRAVVDQLREELTALTLTASGEELQFAVKEIEVELQVGVTKSVGGNGKISFKVFDIGAEIGGKGDYTTAHTQKVKLKLEPIFKDPKKGPIVKVSSSKPRKPAGK